MSTTEEELFQQLQLLNEQRSKIQEELDKFSYKKRFDLASINKGKFFKETPSEFHPEYVKCIHVYDIRPEDCKPECIFLTYYTNLDTYFNVQYYDYFDLKDDFSNWIEITKDEFMQHYNEVFSKIQKSLNL